MAHQSSLKGGASHASSLRGGGRFSSSIAGIAGVAVLAVQLQSAVGAGIPAHVAAPLLGTLGGAVGTNGDAALRLGLAAELGSASNSAADTGLGLQLPVQLGGGVGSGGNADLQVGTLTVELGGAVGSAGDTGLGLGLPAELAGGLSSASDTGLGLALGTELDGAAGAVGDAGLGLQLSTQLGGAVSSSGDTGLELGTAGLAAYILAEWDAGDVVATGTAVDSLTDRQSGGYDLVTVAGSPTLEATGGPGGGPCVDFDGDRVRVNGITRNQPHAVVLTVSFIGDSGTFMDSFGDQIFHGALSWSLNVYAGGGGSIDNGDQAYGAGFQTWALLFDGDDSYMERNGTPEGSGGGSGQPGSDDGVGITFGGAFDGASHLHLKLARMTLVDGTDLADVDTVAAEHGVAFGTFSP